MFRAGFDDDNGGLPRRLDVPELSVVVNLGWGEAGSGAGARYKIHDIAGDNTARSTTGTLYYVHLEEAKMREHSAEDLF
jgi:hypothetical protein